MVEDAVGESKVAFAHRAPACSIPTMQHRVVHGVLVAVLLAGGLSARAAGPSEAPSFRTLTHDSDLVVKGTVVEHTPPVLGSTSHVCRLQPERALKGGAQKPIEVRYTRDTGMAVGSTWYLFLEKMDGYYQLTAPPHGTYRVADGKVYEGGEVLLPMTEKDLSRQIKRYARPSEMDWMRGR